MAQVSVVIVNRNNRELLAACLESLAADLPEPPASEIVVVDNDSSDGSASWLREAWPSVRLIALSHNSGFSVACNLGARAARGRIAVFLNNDTVVQPGWSSALVRAIDSAPDVVMAGGLTIFQHEPHLVNSAGVRIGFSAAGTDIGFREPLDDLTLEEKDVAGVSGVSMAVDRSWFLDAGGFDEAFFMYFEDVDLCLRAWLEGHRIRFVPDSVVLHAFGGTSGTRYSETRNFYASRNRMLTALKLFPPAHMALALAASVVHDVVVVAWLAVADRRHARRATSGKARGIASFAGQARRGLAARRAFQPRRRRSMADLRATGVIDPVGASLVEFLRFRRM